MARLPEVSVDPAPPTKLPEVSLLDESAPPRDSPTSSNGTVYGDPCLYDVSFDAIDPSSKSSRLLQHLLGQIVKHVWCPPRRLLVECDAQGGQRLPVANQVFQTALCWWRRVGPKLAQEAVDRVSLGAARQFEALDACLTQKLVQLCRLILKYTTERDHLAVQSQKLEEANDRVLSLEAELEMIRHDSSSQRTSVHSISETPSLELAHLREAAMHERAELQKAVAEVEEQLVLTEAELSKSRRTYKCVNARLKDERIEKQALQQEKEALREQLLQLEHLKQSDLGAMVNRLESELAETRMKLAQSQEDNDNLEFEISQLRDPSVSSLNSSFDRSVSPPPYRSVHHRSTLAA